MAFEFIPDDDSGESQVTLEMKPGTNLGRTTDMAFEVDKILNKNEEVLFTLFTSGTQNNEMNKASFIVKLKEDRKITTEQFREKIRGQLAHLTDIANPLVTKFDASGASQGQPITLNLVSPNNKALEDAANSLVKMMKADPRYKGVDSNYRSGKPEFQIKLKPGAAKEYGINTSVMGSELRAQVEGVEAAKFRENGREYEVRVRVAEDQRDLKETYKDIYVPNINRKLVRLADIADGKEVGGPATIERQNRARYIQIVASPAPGVRVRRAGRR